MSSLSNNNNNKTTSSNPVLSIINTNPKKRKRPPMSFMSNRNVKRRIDEQNNDSLRPKSKSMSKSRKKMSKIKNKNTNSDFAVQIIEKSKSHRKRIKIVNRNRMKTKTNKNTPNINRNRRNSPSPPPKPPAPPKPIEDDNDNDLDLEQEPPLPLITERERERDNSGNNINIPIIKESDKQTLTVEWDNSQSQPNQALNAIIDNGEFRYAMYEEVLCWYEDNLYDAKVRQRRIAIINNDKQYLIHYNRFNNKWDEWVCEDKILPKTLQNIALICAENKKSTMNNLNIYNNTKHKFNSIYNSQSTKNGEPTRKKLIKSKEVSKKQKNVNINPFGSPAASVSMSPISSLPKVNVSNYAELQNKYNILQEKYREKSEKCVQYKNVARKLYSECVSGESPRWHLIKSSDIEQRVCRDAELAQLRSQISSLYPKGSIFVSAVDKWKGRQELEASVKQFVTLNGEYKINAVTMIGPYVLDLRLILEKFLITNHERIPTLNGQFGVRAKKDIPKNVCVGQYFGGELLQSAFGKVFEGTAEECDHNIYAFDQTIDPQELVKLKEKRKRMEIEKKNRLQFKVNSNNGRKRKKKQSYIETDSDSDIDSERDSKVFIIDPFIGDWKKDELILRFVNDCRAQIADDKPSKEDNKYYNVEYVGMKVNGWPQTYLVAKRDIKSGEELTTYYGKEFNNAISMKLEADSKKNLRKQRIDKDILKHLKNDIISSS